MARSLKSRSTPKNKNSSEATSQSRISTVTSSSRSKVQETLEEGVSVHHLKQSEFLLMINWDCT